MAYTSIIPVRCLDRAVDYVRDKTKTTRGPKSLQDAVDYAINREKTELDCFETGLSCVCETAFEDMRDTVQRWQQTAGVQGYHLVQSFAEGEVTPELAHQIGVELAEQLLQGRFQTVVTTHLNTKHYHNHIVWCSVALDNGRKYHSNAKSYYTEVRARSDALCRKYGLSIIETKESEQSSMPYHVWLDEQENRPNWTSMVRQDVDEAISQALTWRQFLQCLSQKGYTFRFNRKYPTLKPPGKPRPIRFKTLGKQYTPEAIQQRILYSQKTYPAEPHVRHVRLHGTYQKVRKLKGLRVFYYRELYMLGVFHRKPWHPSPAVREEIRQLDKRIEQYEFLMNRDIMLTLRPLKENGQWGAKCRKAYDLDENGQRIPDGKGGWKNHREDTTDWNDKGNVEIWRAAWAAYTNRALESAGRPERIDHRSYKRQGIDKIPSVHLGPAASQMEKRGIRTDKGEVNRQIVADNKLLKEIKARITRLYRWSKAEAEKPQTQQSSLTALWEAQQQLNAPRTRTGKIRALQESAALFSFLQANGIQSMQQLHEKIADMNSCYYDLRGKIVKAERRIAILTERGEMWEQYNQYKSIHKQLAKVKPEKREQFEQRHSRELILYDAAARYLKELKDSGEGITPKAWQREIDQLTAGKQTDTLAMKSMREDLKAVERLRKTAEQLSRQERDKSHDRGPER